MQKRNFYELKKDKNNKQRFYTARTQMKQNYCQTGILYGIRVAEFTVCCVEFCRSWFNCHFILFLLATVLSVFLQLTASDYSLISSNFSCSAQQLI